MRWVENLNAYIDQKLSNFWQQLTQSLPDAAAIRRLIFSLVIEPYYIPTQVKLYKLVSLYLGTTSPIWHLYSYIVHVALNLSQMHSSASYSDHARIACPDLVCESPTRIDQEC